jgi:hypothetical protein
MRYSNEKSPKNLSAKKLLEDHDKNCKETPIDLIPRRIK